MKIIKVKVNVKVKIIIWRAPGPCGASPTQPYKCGQNVKVKIKVNLFISALAKINDNAVLTLILTF